MEDRSRRRARLILIVGLLLALGAGAGTYFYATSASSAVPPPVQTTDVIVAAREIPLRTIVTAADVRVAKYNADVAPPGALARSADVVGRIVMQPVAVGEPLLASKFAAADGKPWTVFPVGEEITPTSPHYRVMTITVVDQFAVGGTILPGEIVDVMYTFSLDPLKFFEEDEDAPEDAPELILDQTAKIILERVIVLDRVGQVYTIRTDAETAEKLAYLQTSGGQMWLLLRAIDDQRSSETTGATFGPVYETYGFRVPERVSP
ncbi:MAG: Flp pilus assembly protein CpaB [Candidatus Limnocylindria bacterium]